MDPNTARKRLVELAEKIIQAGGEMDYGPLLSRAEELAETFIGLDEWLNKGGFKPEPWNATAVSQGPLVRGDR